MSHLIKYTIYSRKLKGPQSGSARRGTLAVQDTVEEVPVKRGKKRTKQTGGEIDMWHWKGEGCQNAPAGRGRHRGGQRD